jgi:hypothetical protein
LVHALKDLDACQDLIQASSAPDRLRDTSVDVPWINDKHVLDGRNLSSFQHFQRTSELGYCFRDDPATDWAEREILKVADIAIEWSPEGWGERVPVPHGVSTPQEIACKAQSGTALVDFGFPAASTVGSFYAGLALASWRRGDYEQWRRQAGYVLHLTQDACVPHHAWATLLLGHAEWEDEIERLWLQHVNEIKQSDDKAGTLYRSTVEEAVLVDLDSWVETSVGGLIRGDAHWAFRTFGLPCDMPECPLSLALEDCLQAISSSVRALVLVSEG